ncbi:MAG: hypothetical protein V4864_00060 [Pseudomonadota bacterium]
MPESTTEDNFDLAIQLPSECTRIEIAGFSAMALSVDASIGREELGARMEQAFALLVVRNHRRSRLGFPP